MQRLPDERQILVGRGCTFDQETYALEAQPISRKCPQPSVPSASLCGDGYWGQGRRPSIGYLCRAVGRRRPLNQTLSVRP